MCIHLVVVIQVGWPKARRLFEGLVVIVTRSSFIIPVLVLLVWY